MTNPIRQLLEQTSPDTLVKVLIINGKAENGVQKFVKFDSLTGLVYFNKSNSTFVAIVEKIDKLEFYISVIALNSKSTPKLTKNRTIYMSKNRYF